MPDQPDQPDQWKSCEARPDTASSIRTELERRLDEAPSGANASLPPAIPDHHLLRRIGSGAYGDVWLARSTLGTLRAVKVVYRSHFRHDRPYEREFHGIVKYEPVSRTHPGLIQVLHVGRNDDTGYFFYVMELADGEEMQNEQRKIQNEQRRGPASAAAEPSILHSEFFILNYRPRTLKADLKRRGRLPPAECVEIGLALTTALAHLHAHGLVHRDIKPGNVIFVGGQPKLADIGLVTDVGDSRSYVGTEGFIPPEGPGTPQADLYSLGKLLYELVTGRDRMEFPDLPANVEQLPERDALLELNEILSRACVPDPKQRYASAAQLQADLNLFLAGRSLRQARGIERRLAKMKRLALAACGVMIVALVAAWVSRLEERRAKEHARTEAGLRARAEAAERESRQRLYTALLEQARATVLTPELGHRVRALDAIRRAAAISNTAELRREAFAALSLPDLRFERELPTGVEFTLAELDPDFERVAICRGRGPVEVRATSDQRLLATLRASTNLMAYNVLWSPDGRFLAVKRDYDPAGRRADVEVWDVPVARCVLRLQDVPWGATSFHPRLPRIMVGQRGGGVMVWDLENSREIAQARLPGVANRIRFAPEGERLAASYESGAGWAVSVHESENGALQASHAIAAKVESIAWHPGGRWLATTDQGGLVLLIDTQTGEARTLGHHKAVAATTAFSPDGDYLISGGWDRELICWDVRTMRHAFTIRLNSFRAQFRADGRQCAVGTESGVRILAFERPINHREFAEDLGRIQRPAAFSPDGRWLAVPGEERLGVWDLGGTGPGAVAIEGARAHVFFSPDSTQLFANREESFVCWRISPGSNVGSSPVLEPLPVRQPNGFTSACLVSNSVALTSSQGTRVVALTDLETGEGRTVLTSVGRNGASPDGRWLTVCRAYSPFLYVYRLPGLTRVAKLTNQLNIGRCAFSPRGDEVALTSRNRVVFWSTTTWQPTRELPGCRDILFAPDGRTWWLTKDFSTAGLYDPRTAEPLLLLPTGMLPLALSPDGCRLVVSADARRLQVWDLPEMRAQVRELGLDWADPN